MMIACGITGKLTDCRVDAELCGGLPKHHNTINKDKLRGIKKFENRGK